MLVGGYHLLATLDPVEQAFEAVGVLGPHHQVEFRHPAQQGFALLLGHTAGHHQGEMGIGAFALGLAPQIAIDLLLGVIANRTGVV